MQRKQNGTFANYFHIFVLDRIVFVCFKPLRNQNRTLHFQKMISKRNQNVSIAPGFSKDKRKLLVVPEKFGNGPEQKLLDHIFLVLIENVLFRSKNEYIRSFLEQKQQNGSFRSWKNFGLTLLCRTDSFRGKWIKFFGLFLLVSA